MKLKKNNAKQLLLSAVVLSVFAVSVTAQSPDLILENGVKAHAGIDAIYKTFSDGYRTLKPETVANLYALDAAYLAPGREITNGREAILQDFTRFFSNVKERRQTMNISFQIFQRKVDKTLGYDVGIYSITFFEDGRKINDSTGKFVVVAVREKDGRWLFQVDGYSDLKPRVVD